MSKQDLVALAKHIESDISCIVGFGGDALTPAKEAAKKVKELIAALEGEGDAEAPVADDTAAAAEPEPVAEPADDSASDDMESEGAPAKPEPKSAK